MSSHPNCYSNSCIHNCCNYWGDCPTYSYDCYYYYRSNTGTIIGAVIGSVLAVVFIVAIACYCYRKRQQERIQ